MYRRVKVTPIWQQKEQERISSLNNHSLLEETLDAAQGDDYDGCFTPRGTVTYDMLRNELNLRLKDWFKE